MNRASGRPAVPAAPIDGELVGGPRTDRVADRPVVPPFRERAKRYSILTFNKSRQSKEGGA